MNVIFFPVDANRDLDTFLRIQTRISAGNTVTPDEEMLWLRNNVNSTALYDYLREHGEEYDRMVMGPYLFGLIYFAARIHPAKTILLPCLHDEPFAYLPSIRNMFHDVQSVMFNSEPERDLATRLGMVPRQASVVGMGLDPFDANPTIFTTTHRLESPYLIYSGRREPLKGTPLLVDYLAAFRGRTKRDIALVLTGSGAVDTPSEMKGHILDLGFVPETEKQNAMAGAIAFCHPSTNESLGIVLLESWLARTPALVNAKSEVLRHHCRQSNAGLWFHTYPEFEEELVLLLDSRDIRRSMGEAGRKYVLDTYSWSVVEPKLFAALDRN
jgi:glycosyltransferase involved in cell wall biosynthesis